MKTVRLILSAFLFAFPLAGQTAPAVPDAAFKGKIHEIEAQARAGRQHEAEEILKELRKTLPADCSECWSTLAITYGRLGSKKEALAIADEMAKSSISGAPAVSHYVRGTVLRILAGDDNKQLQAAEHELREAASLAPENADFHYSLAMLLLKRSSDTDAVAELKRYLELAPHGQYAAHAAELIQNPRRGRFAFLPSFEATTKSGETVSNTSLNGKIVVFDFWATWCGPCRESVGELRDLAKQYAGRLTLISVSADEDKNAWSTFIDKHNMSWQQIFDGDGQMQRKFNVRAFPTYLVVMPDGAIAKRLQGLNPQQTIAGRLREELKALPQLAQTASADH
jgi:thioredoxin-like negative regulator of GroEL